MNGRLPSQDYAFCLMPLHKADSDWVIPRISDFEDEDNELQDFSSNTGESGEVRASSTATEMQRIGKEMRQKVEKYLDTNRDSIPCLKLKHSNSCEDLPDGQLIYELNRLGRIEKEHQQNEQFILLFSKKPKHAIGQYITRGYIKEDTPAAIAEYLNKAEGIDKVSLGQYFGANEEKVQKVLRAYCNLLHFRGIEFDQALRRLLSHFRLPGEAQQIERVIWQFALTFYEANQDTYDNADELFPLAYAIIMLGTDAHNPKQEKKMTTDQFIKNTKRACPSIQEDYLLGIYQRITKEKFETEVGYFEALYNRLKDLQILNLGDAIAFNKELIQGDVFLKVCRGSVKFVQRKLYLSEDQQKIMWISDPKKGEEEPRFIWIRDITDVTLGRGSEVMRKNKVPVEFDSLCFTITTTTRTLDLKAKTTKDRSKWVNYLRAILLERREAKRLEMEEKSKSLVNNETIEQMWNNDIFPNWDRHWDYRNRKPKVRGYIAKGLQVICSCCKSSQNNEVMQERARSLGIAVKASLLQTLWCYGLPPASRKTLWDQKIGNNLSLTPLIVEDIRRRKKVVEEFVDSRMDKEVVEMAEVMITMRPDIAPIRDLLLISEVVYNIFPRNLADKATIVFINLVHSHHFLSFYRGDKNEIDLRVQLFEQLMESNVSTVAYHFKGLKLETRMYLVNWFLSVFSNCFEKDLLYRIWDNFILEGELYLFKVGIALVKYYEIELKMCTFHQGLELLKAPTETSSVLFFHILNHEIEVTEAHYDEYIEKRKHAVIKTKVQSIPLE